MRYFIS